MQGRRMRTMRITTSKGGEYGVIYIDNPIQDRAMLMLAFSDPRRLPEIAAEFDGLAEVRRYDEQQGDKVFEGYTLLKEIRRLPTDDRVCITLERE